MNIVKRGLFLIFALCSIQASAIGFTVKDTNVCANTPFLFKDTSTAPAGLTITNRKWEFDGLNIINTTADSVFFAYNLVGTKYTVTLTLTYSDNNTQSYSFPRNFYIRSLPIIDSFFPTDSITCPGVPIFFTAKSSQHIHGTTLGFWNLEYGDGNATTLFTPNEFQNYAYSASGQYTAKYTVSDQLGCVSSVTRNMAMYAHPIVDFVPINTQCKDSLVTYENRTVGRDSTWTWSWSALDSSIINKVNGGDSVLNSTAILGVNTKDFIHQHIFSTTLPNKHQTVILIGQNKYKCFDSVHHHYRVDTTPILVITPSIDTTICFGESVKYRIKGSDTAFYNHFTWGTRILGDTIVLFTPKNTVTYKVYGKTKLCPPAGKDIKIKVVQPIATNITLAPPNILRGNQSIMKLNPNAVYDSIRWTPDNSLSRPKSDSTGASPILTTKYVARTYYNLFNYVCYHDDSTTLFVNANCDIDSLKIPTAFTPNGDDKNDEFYIKSFSLKRILSFNVYNRWGDKVFKIENVPADDKLYGWNGKLNNTGEDLPVGVYIYNISAYCKNDQLVNFQGEITILR